jgi:hypothetical protein
LRRHAVRSRAAEFGASQMREWYWPRDLLTAVREQVIPQTSTPEQGRRSRIDGALSRLWPDRWSIEPAGNAAEADAGPGPPLYPAERHNH